MRELNSKTRFLQALYSCIFIVYTIFIAAGIVYSACINFAYNYETECSCDKFWKNIFHKFFFKKHSTLESDISQRFSNGQ